MSSQRIWNEANSTLEQRIQAARVLVPLGTRKGAVEHVLGEPDGTGRHRGSRITILDETGQDARAISSQPYEEWMSRYEFNDGTILIIFEPQHMTCIGIAREEKAQAVRE